MSLFFLCSKGKSAPESALFLEKEKEKVEKRDNSNSVRRTSTRLVTDIFRNGQKTGVKLSYQSNKQAVPMPNCLENLQISSQYMFFRYFLLSI